MEGGVDRQSMEEYQGSENILHAIIVIVFVIMCLSKPIKL